jgi:hypothetical protein
MDDLEAIIETSGATAVEIAASAMAERGHKVHPCPNCTKPMIGAYCAVCGQERDTHRRSVWGLIKVLIEDIVSFDSRVMRTGWALVTRPGELARAFREGRTQRYLPALRLYLFVSLIFFLVLGVTNIAIMQLVVVAKPVQVVWVNGKPFLPNPDYDEHAGGKQLFPKLVPISKEKVPGEHFHYSTKVYFFQPIGAYHVDMPAAARAMISQVHVNIDDDGEKPTKEEQAKIDEAKGWMNWIGKRVQDGMQRLVADPASINGPLTTWIPRVLFLLLPLYAFLLEIFYIRKRKQFFYVDHLIFSLTLHTFGFVLLMAAAGAAQFVPGSTVALGTLVIGGVYTLIATRNFYRQNWFWTVVKFASVSFLYLCLFVLPALGVVIALSFLNV